MQISLVRRPLLGAATALALVAGVTGLLVSFPSHETRSQSTPGAVRAPAVPVSVAVVEQRNVALWDEFSGRLEAVERVEIRSRVAGAVKAVHFREGSLVKAGRPARSRSIRIRMPLRSTAPRRKWPPRRPASRSPRTTTSAAQPAIGIRAPSRSAISTSALNAPTRSRGQSARRASSAAVGAAQPRATPKCARRSRAGSAGSKSPSAIWSRPGPGAPVLTTLVSVDPIYASFNADEEVVMRALKSLGAGCARPARPHPGRDGRRRPATARRSRAACS